MNDHDRINDEAAARLNDYAARELLRRAAATLIRWGEAHGRDAMPHGHVRLVDDIMEFLMPAKPTGQASNQGVLTRSDGWTSRDGGLSWQHPAPHGAAPMVPSGVQINSADVRDTTYDRPLPVFPPGGKLIGHIPERPSDLVPLANGRSVDLGGRWTMPT